MVYLNLLNNPNYLMERIKNADECWVVEESDKTVRGVAALSIILAVGLGEIERVCRSKIPR